MTSESGVKNNPGKIVIAKNGPYLVSGKLPLGKKIIVADSKGYSVRWDKGHEYPAQETYALCRCGHSGTKPFCDGTHAKVKFNGEETAGREKYIQQAEKISGPEIDLTDAQGLCAFARFCDRGGSVWRLTQQSGDEKAKKLAIEEASQCPSGRLVVWDKKTGKQIEPSLKPSVSLVEDPEKKVSGPIMLSGGVPVESSDGTTYEKRNRVTLCRCGESDNKPFCDGTHASIGFTDGDSNLS